MVSGWDFAVEPIQETIVCVQIHTVVFVVVVIVLLFLFMVVMKLVILKYDITEYYKHRKTISLKVKARSSAI